MLNLTPKKVKEMIETKEISPERGVKIIEEIKKAKRIWQPIHSEVKQRIFPE